LTLPEAWRYCPSIQLGGLMTLNSTFRLALVSAAAGLIFLAPGASATIGPLPDSDVYAIALDPTAPGTLYAGTGVGVYKTIDFGQNWTRSDYGITGEVYSNMVVDPADSQKVYLGTNGYGFFYSWDGGASWSHGEGPYHQTVKSIAIDPDQSNVLSIGAFRDIYRSYDFGATWGPLHLFDYATGVLSIAHDPVSTDVMYIGTNTRGLMKSTDRGFNWSNTASTQITTVVVIDPFDHNVVYGLGFISVMKSTDGGATWRTVLDVPYAAAVAFDTSNPGTMYSGFYYNGVYASSDDGETWSEANAGLPTMEIRSLAVDPDDGIVYAGTEGFGIYVSYDGGQSWN